MAMAAMSVDTLRKSEEFSASVREKSDKVSIRSAFFRTSPPLCVTCAPSTELQQHAHGTACSPVPMLLD